MLQGFSKQEASFSGDENQYIVKVVSSQRYMIHAFEIDVARNGYFAVVYQELSTQPSSADGLVVARGLQDDVEDLVLVIEIKNTLEHVGRAARQLRTTIEHFCRCSQQSNVPDDGERHHQRTTLRLSPRHRVIGVYIGGPTNNSRKARVRNDKVTMCEKDVYLFPYETRKRALVLRIDDLYDECKQRFGIQ